MALSGCTSGTNDDPIETSSDLAAACTAGTAFTQAAAYGGPPPHPIVIFDSSDGNGSDSMLPGGYSAYSAFGYTQIDPAVAEAYSVTSGYERTQLVGCVERTESQPTGTTCPFDTGSPAPLASATYELTIYEARTATVVGGPIRIDPDNMECPSSALVDSTSPEVYTSPSDAQVLGEVRRYVEG